ncbi:MAG: TonB-dependent receptor, partial [Bacteroidota bacterium]
MYDKDNGEPISFTNVILKGTTYGSTTSSEGLYDISQVPPGNYILLVTYLGYDSLLVPITLKADEILNKKLFITKGSKNLNEFVISAKKEEQKQKVLIGITKITPTELKMVPSVGGEPDLAQYLQVIPGIISTGDQGGQLYIRGGTPIQNLVLLDGMTIFNPFHSIGLFSVFDPDIIRNADVFTGGFNAEYGGRISSVMDITTRDGNKKHYSGKIATNPFTSKVILEGPISRAENEGDGSTSFLISARTSYLQQTSKVLYKYVDSTGLPYNFTDLYGKISMTGSSGSKVNFFGFNFADKVDFPSLYNLKWTATGFGSNFELVPGGSSVVIDGIFAYSNYGISIVEPDNEPRTSKINSFNFGLNFTYFFNKDELKYGLEVSGKKTNLEFLNPINLQVTEDGNSTEFGAFFKYKKIIGNLIMEPGFRLNFYGSLGEVSPEPRLGLKYNVSDKFRLKFSGGFYSQNLVSTTSELDVVNLFYGFLTGSDNIQKQTDGSNVSTLLQTARHAIAGFEVDLPHHFELNIEGYIKDFTQVEEINPYKVYEDNGENSSKPDILRKDFILENGVARGVDFLLKYDYKHLYLWMVYDYAYNVRNDGRQSYSPLWDRANSLNLVGSYTFGKKLDWTIDARWNYGSGFPFTQSQGFYEQLTFEQGIGTNYTRTNGKLAPIYAGLDAGRLPAYNRFDITVKKKWELSKRSTLEANVSSVNVFDRQNIFYYNRILNQRINQLPILPSAG